MNGKGRIVELACDMRPTGSLALAKLDQIPAAGLGGVELLTRTTGGDISIQIADAPGIPGRVVVGVVERFPSGYTDVLWAGWSDSYQGAMDLGLPQFKKIKASSGRSFCP
jgi:hypothetical protein